MQGHASSASRSTGAGPPRLAGGHFVGDSMLVYGIGTSNEKVDSQRVALSGPILLPTMVPLAVALGERPTVGKSYLLPMLDPSTMATKTVTVRVAAESVFTIADSAVFDSSSARWRGIKMDTVRAWQLASGTTAAFNGWVDEHGRVVQTTQLGFLLKRVPYEVAFENWKADSGHVAVSAEHDIFETTAIAANRRPDHRVSALRVRLSGGASLRGFDLDGRGQRLMGDTLIVSPETDSALASPQRLPMRRRSPPYSRAEALVPSDDPRIMDLAKAIAGGSREPRDVAQRLVTWVHDSIAQRVTVGVPSALKVLANRSGDCGEHTQLYVALARSLGLPARVAVGLVYVDGAFYYHVWPEVLLGDWVAVDPTFGQFPADAAHLRFIVGGLTRQTEMLRLMGNLTIDVVSVNGTAVANTAPKSK